MKGLSISLIFLSFQAFADPQSLIEEFKQINDASIIGKISDQAFYYLENGKVEGYQVDKLQKLASVTKVLTTFAASETQDLYKRFVTRIYLTPDFDCISFFGSIKSIK